MADLWQILIIMLAIGGLLLYFPTNRVQAPGRWFFHDTWFDEYIPLIPYFVIPYVALFPYALFTVPVVWTTEYRYEFLVCIVLAAWSAALAWYFLPAGILRKRKIGLDFFSQMIVWIYEHDHENNTFPSSHVFYAIICSYYLARALPEFLFLFVVIGFLISISTVFVKQHHVADIVGGIVWAFAAIMIAKTFLG